MADDGRSIEEIAADLHKTRSALRDAEAENKKLPAVRQEQERLSASLKKEQDKRREANSRVGELEAEVQELGRKLRTQDDLEREIQQAEADRADALGEAEKARQDLGKAQSDNQELLHRLDIEKKNVARLKKHEEQSRLFKQAIDMVKDIT